MREDRKKASVHTEAFSIKSLVGIGNGFLQYMEAAKKVNEIRMHLHKLFQRNPDSVILIEVPAYSQSAKASLAIGMCWAMAMSLKETYQSRLVIIDPGVLKYWSESKRGDAKLKVKEKVESRMSLLSHQQGNDNIVDAIGICFAFSDLVKSMERNER